MRMDAASMKWNAGIRLLMAVTVLLILALGVLAGEARQVASAQTERPGEVYLLRGLFNVFSTGMDTLGEKLRAAGYNTKVVNHASWSSIVRRIGTRYGKATEPDPVFLIGHSLGADAVIKLAQRLDSKNVPVTLAILFDPVNPRPVPPNVERMINFFKSTNGWGKAVAPVAGFTKTLINKGLKDRSGMGHISIDKSRTLHSEVLQEMLSISKSYSSEEKKAGSES